MIIFEQDIQVITEILNDLEKDFQEVKGLILTEDDLKCQLYSRLLRNPNFSLPRETNECNVLANSIHTEVSWFDDNGKLKIKPDITILEPSSLSIFRALDGLPLPSKQFNFDGKAIVFELKFVRDPNGITDTIFIKEILKDYKKIRKLYGKLDNQGAGHQIYCFFVVFNKTNQYCDKFKEFFLIDHNSPRYRMFYGSGNVDLETISNNQINPRRKFLKKNFRFPYLPKRQKKRIET